MKVMKSLARGALAVLLTAGVATSAGATTLVRLSLDDLVAGNSKIVVGEVVDTHSHWNQEGTFILTDVRFATSEVVKGAVKKESELTFTILGGQVGDLTTLIVGGPELVPGRSYLLFLNEQNLPGVKGALTVREHVQGAFDIKLGQGGLRAVSQASRFGLLPDKLGSAEAPGGAEGFPLTTLIDSVRTIEARQRSGREVK